MDRKTRSNKEFVLDWQKRKITKNTVSHFIIFPAILSTVGKTNDFFLHAFKLSLINKNLRKDLRCQHLFRGLRIREAIDIKDLQKSPVTGWFTSSRSNDLEKIGKIAGYFINRFAGSVGKSLDDSFVPEFYPPIVDEGFDEIVKALKENQVIVPVVIKLDISSRSAFDVNRFVGLTEGEVDRLGVEEQVKLTRHVQLYRIATNLYDWAWKLLDTLEYQDRQQFLCEGIPVMDNFGALENVSYALEQQEQIEISQQTVVSSHENIPYAQTTAQSIDLEASIKRISTCTTKCERKTRNVRGTSTSNKVQFRKTSFRRKYKSTRSHRPADIPPNTTFEWVSLNGYPCRPVLIHPPSMDGSCGELAQVITMAGDLCQKLYKFNRLAPGDIDKPKNYLVALRKFNSNYSKNYV